MIFCMEAYIYLCHLCYLVAARKRKQEVETSESMGGVRMNPACTPRQHGKRATFLFSYITYVEFHLFLHYYRCYALLSWL
jgi:hypothetical protein